jgi:hypothetical protein
MLLLQNQNPLKKEGALKVLPNQKHQPQEQLLENPIRIGFKA